MAASAISGLTALTAPAVEDALIVVDDSASDNKSLALSYLVRDTGGTGAIVTGAHTLTVPADMTAAGRGVANTFTAVQVIAGGGTDTVPELRLGPYLSSPYESFGWAIQNNNSDGGRRWLHARYNTNIARFGFSNESTGEVTQECLYLHVNGHIGAGTGSDSGQLTVNGELAIVDGMTAPSTTSGWAKIYVDSADGDLKVKFGDGTVKTISTDS
jgi:hypothetical protein